MKRRPVLTAMAFLLGTAACSGPGPTRPDTGASVEVFVHWNREGVPGHRVDVVETGQTQVTDGSGLVRFDVRPGDYTMRVFGLNQGGPSGLPVDFPVSASPGSTVRVEALDCLVCVQPRRGSPTPRPVGRYSSDFPGGTLSHSQSSPRS